MSRTHRALAMLALSLAVATATTAVAAAATPPITGIEDHNDRLLRNQRAARAERTQATAALARSMERNPDATAVVTSPAPTEDQNDRLLRNLQAARAERTQATVALARSMERDLTPVPAVDIVAAQPSVRPDPAAPGAVVDVLATLLLGLVGGLVGGGAASAAGSSRPAGGCTAPPPPPDRRLGAPRPGEPQDSGSPGLGVPPAPATSVGVSTSRIRGACAPADGRRGAT